MAYSEAQTAEAKAVLASCETVAEARRILAGRWGKAPAYKTCRRWQREASKNPERNAAIGQKATQKRDDLVVRFTGLVHQILDHITEEKLAKTSAAQLVTMAGVLTDKIQRAEDGGEAPDWVQDYFRELARQPARPYAPVQASA